MKLSLTPGHSIGGPLILAPVGALERVTTVPACVDKFFVDIRGGNAKDFAQGIVPGLPVRTISSSRARVGPLSRPQAHFLHKKVEDYAKNNRVSYTANLTSTAATSQQLLDACDHDLTGNYGGTTGGFSVYAGNWKVDTVESTEDGVPVRLLLCSDAVDLPKIEDVHQAFETAKADWDAEREALKTEISDLSSQLKTAAEKKEKAPTAAPPKAETKRTPAKFSTKKTQSKK